MESERTIQTFRHQNNQIAVLVQFQIYDPDVSCRYRVIGREYQPLISDTETVDLIQSMNSYDKIRLRKRHFNLYKLAHHYGIEEKHYLSDEDLLIHVANLGSKNLTDLYRKDNKAWRLIKNRNLSDALFSARIGR